MKKLLLAASAVIAVAMSAPAGAADMRVPMKAPPPPPPVFNWTGCYIGAGGGYGMWNQEFVHVTDPGGVALTLEQTNGGRGWFGTVQAGCDYQITPSIVIGAFADYDFSNIKGDFEFSLGNSGRGEAEAVVGSGWPDWLGGVAAAADLRFRRLHSGAVQPSRP